MHGDEGLLATLSNQQARYITHLKITTIWQRIEYLVDMLQCMQQVHGSESFPFLRDLIICEDNSKVPVILDSLLDSDVYDEGYGGPGSYMSDVLMPPSQAELVDQCLEKPLPHIYKSIILMAFDTEGVNGDCSEFGFAWLNLSDVCDVAPGHKGKNWWNFNKAKHFLRDPNDFRPPADSSSARVGAVICQTPSQMISKSGFAS